MFDLRSDTVTRPCAAMRRSMAEAEVGDDVYGEDPTVRRLQERVAELVGKAAAIFVPSGTMANQIALLCQTRPGDEVIIGEGAHCAYYESGAGAAWSGVQFQVAGQGGSFDVAQLEAALKPDIYVCPQASLVVIENTHNRAGGKIVSQSQIEAVAGAARTHGLAVHLDGARIWNVAAALERPVAELCQPADTVAVCFSKGLGAPVGSALCGEASVIARALRFRKMLGGGMRQAGILAAGALYALEHNRARLSDDHHAARQIAAALADLEGVTVAAVDTNIINIDVQSDAVALVNAAKNRGVLFSALGAKSLRMVTHHDVVADNFENCIEQTRAAFSEVLG